jgi:hypothetical protein
MVPVTATRQICCQRLVCKECTVKAILNHHSDEDRSTKRTWGGSENLRMENENKWRKDAV